MPTSKLEVYNLALGHLGSRRLASLSENREPRRELDAEWHQAVLACLERGQWLFATRAVQVLPSDSVVPPFGYALAYPKPDDWLRTIEVCSDDRFACPVRAFSDESGYWWTDAQPLFVRYVSTDPAWGLDLSKWSPAFTMSVSIHLARQTCERITGSLERMQVLEKLAKQARLDAKALDAMNGPPARAPMGSWLRARLGGPDGGERGSGASAGTGGLVSTTPAPGAGSGGGPGDPITVIVDGGLEG